MRTMIANPRPRAESTGTRLRRAERSRSSGIGSRIKAWFPASPRVIATNYAAAASLILLGYALYAIVPARPRRRASITKGCSPGELGRLPGRCHCVSAGATDLLRDLLR